MPMLSEPVPMWFIAATIGAIIALIGLGIMMVRWAKRKKEQLR